MNTKKKKINFRLLSQVLFFAIILWTVITHAFSLHAICPFGGVVSLYELFTSGEPLKWIQSSSFVLMVIIFILTILFGPIFCGWICPMGSIQEWTGKLGRKIMGKRYNKIIPYKVDRVLRYLRYLMLIWVLYMTAKTATLVFWNIDPYYALFHFWTGEFAISGLIVLIVVLVLSLFVERPWCKYACPYGAVLGLTNLFRVFKIRRNDDKCVSCNMCSNRCPMNIKVSEKKIVRDHQCISCLECTSDNCCPVDEACSYEMSTGNKSKNK